MISDKPSNIDIKATVQGVTDATAFSRSKDKVSSGSMQEATPKAAKNVNEVEANIPAQPGNNVDSASRLELAEKQREQLKEKINEAIPKVRELLQRNQRSLDFKVAEEDNRVIITVIDKETDEVIRQIPPEDVLLIAESIDQGLDSWKGGAILDSKA